MNKVLPPASRVENRSIWYVVVLEGEHRLVFIFGHLGKTFTSVIFEPAPFGLGNTFPGVVCPCSRTDWYSSHEPCAFYRKPTLGSHPC